MAYRQMLFGVVIYDRRYHRAHFLTHTVLSLWNYEPVSNKETDGNTDHRTSLKHCMFNEINEMFILSIYDASATMIFFNRWRSSMMVADGLVPIWRKGI